MSQAVIIKLIHPMSTTSHAFYDAMFEAQQGRCFICNRDRPESWEEGTVEEFYAYRREQQEHLCREGNVKGANAIARWLVQDHDHATGVVRALVCPSCNNALAGVDKLLRLNKLDFVMHSYLKLGQVEIEVKQ